MWRYYCQYWHLSLDFTSSDFSFRNVKTVLSAWLSRLLIPIVIIYNMVFYQPGSLSLMLFSSGSAFLIFFAYLALFKDRLLALCVSYTNMGWLGFPFAMALFGPDATAPIVALYIGVSLLAMRGLLRQSPLHHKVSSTY